MIHISNHTLKKRGETSSIDFTFGVCPDTRRIPGTVMYEKMNDCFDGRVI
jgi:hypothetical protein